MPDGDVGVLLIRGVLVLCRFAIIGRGSSGCWLLIWKLLDIILFVGHRSQTRNSRRGSSCRASNLIFLGLNSVLALVFLFVFTTHGNVCALNLEFKKSQFYYLI